jgi:hypothetical protein
MTGFKKDKFWLDRTGPSTARYETTEQSYVDFMQEHTDGNREQYDDNKAIAILNGEAVWLARATDGDHGIVLEYYRDRRRIGLIDFCDDIADISVATYDKDNPFIPLDSIGQGTGPENLMEAIARLEAIAKPAEED